MRLSEEQLQAFDEEGYVFLPEVFSPEEVALLRGEATKIYAMERDEVWRESTGVARTGSGSWIDT